jgi:hypothetical protein
VTIATVAAPLSIVASGQRLLDVVQQILVNDYGIEIPDIVGVMPGGLIAYDGPQLTVNLVTITLGLPGAARTTTDHPTKTQQFYEWNLMLLRDTPVIGNDGTASTPDPVDLAASAVQLFNDASAMWATMVTINANYLMSTAGVPFGYGPLHALGPDGGLAGCGLSVFVLADS